MVTVYMVEPCGDTSPELTDFVTSKRQAHRLAHGDPDADGDFDYHKVDACKMLHELYTENFTMSSAILRAARIMCEMCPFDDGKPHVKNIEHYEALLWVCEHVPEVAEMYSITEDDIRKQDPK